VITTSDFPSLHLNQTGGPEGTYEWHVAGDETEFVVQDVTANKVPFTISTGAPSDSLVIHRSGQVGLGTETPQGNLHIFGDGAADVFNAIGPDPGWNGTAMNFGYSGFSFGIGSGFFNVRPAPGAVAPNPSLRFATGNVQRMIITNTGSIGVGTLAPTELLEVAGKVKATAFRVGAQDLNVPDYVFEPDYKLLSLKQLAKYIEKEKHLPEIPSAKEIKASGIDLSEMQMHLLKKVEELTLYTLQQENTIGSQQRTIQTQSQLIQELQRTLARINSRLTVIERQSRKTDK